MWDPGLGKAGCSWLAGKPLFCFVLFFVPHTIFFPGACTTPLYTLHKEFVSGTPGACIAPSLVADGKFRVYGACITPFWTNQLAPPTDRPCPMCGFGFHVANHPHACIPLASLGLGPLPHGPWSPSIMGLASPYSWALVLAPPLPCPQVWRDAWSTAAAAGGVAVQQSGTTRRLRDRPLLAGGQGYRGGGGGQGGTGTGELEEGGRAFGGNVAHLLSSTCVGDKTVYLPTRPPAEMPSCLLHPSSAATALLS